MRIISLRTLHEFWNSKPAHAGAEGPLRAWYHEVKGVQWATPGSVKAHYGNASILKGSRVVFNIGGNKYRLVVKINYPRRIVYIRFVGTHLEYDQIDAEKV